MYLPESSDNQLIFDTLGQSNKLDSKTRDRTQQQGPLSPIHNRSSQDNINVDAHACGLCGTSHGAQECYMTESSSNLVRGVTHSHQS